MANHYTIRGGIDSSSLYKEEVTYKVDPGAWTTASKHFGLTQNVTPSVSRSLVKLRGLTGILPAIHTVGTSRDAVDIKAGKSEVTMNVEYQPQEFSFLKMVVGTSSTADGTITYPQATASSEADKRKYLTVPSFTVMQRFDFAGSGDSADSVLKFTGMKVGSWEMGGAIGEPIKCSSSLTGADILIDQTTIATSYPYVALSAEDVYHFTDSQINIGASAIDNLIESFTLTINNNVQGLGDIRSYTNEAVVVMSRDWNLNINLTTENITHLKNLLGGVAGLTKPIKIETITLVLTKAAGKNLTVTLKNLRQSDGIPGMSYGDISKENIQLEAEYGYFVENAS